ncbi:nibrin [Trichonephila clavipes]|nr:nibrin [Trichonephila clavipes]
MECRRTQLEVSEQLGVAQSAISRLWQRIQDDVTAKRNRRSTASNLSRQLSSDTSTTVSRQSAYRRLWHIDMYARRAVRYVPLTTNYFRLRLTCSREHALWTPQQCSCVMFSDEYRFSLQSVSRRILIWRAPGTRYHQENTIKRHRYGGAGWLVWGGIILGSRTDMHVQSVTITGHIYLDVILEQHVRLFRDAMGAEFLFMDDTARSSPCKHCRRMPSIGIYHPYGLASIITGLESNRICVGYAWPTNCSPSTPCLPELRWHCLMSGVIFPKMRLII